MTALLLYVYIQRDVMPIVYINNRVCTIIKSHWHVQQQLCANIMLMVIRCAIRSIIHKLDPDLFVPIACKFSTIIVTNKDLIENHMTLSFLGFSNYTSKINILHRTPNYIYCIKNHMYMPTRLLRHVHNRLIITA